MSQNKQQKINMVKEYYDQGLITDEELAKELQNLKDEYEETPEETDYRNRARPSMNRRRKSVNPEKKYIKKFAFYAALILFALMCYRALGPKWLMVEDRKLNRFTGEVYVILKDDQTGKHAWQPIIEALNPKVSREPYEPMKVIKDDRQVSYLMKIPEGFEPEDKAGFESAMQFNEGVVFESYGENVAYKDWPPLITEVNGETVLPHDSYFFLSAYTRKLEKEYNTTIAWDNIPMSEFHNYFTAKAAKDGEDVLVADLIKDFYVERGLLLAEK